MAERDSIELAEVFAEVARALATDDDHETFTRICEAAVQTVPGCEYVGMSLVVGRSVQPAAGIGEVPGVIDQIQTEVGEGPCLDAIRQHHVFRTGRLADEPRWPHFSRRAHAETGVNSILAFRLFADETTLGALNLYSSALDAFDEDDVALGAVFAAHAAVAMEGARRQSNLERRSETRDAIGIAKGIIMNQRRVTEEAAFTVLVSASQHLNVKLRDIAEIVARTGEVPGAPGSGL